MLTSTSNSITATMTVADVLEQYPDIVTVFLQYGFSNITNPVMRRTVAKVMTLQAGCEMRNVNCEVFVRALNEWIEKT